MTDFLCTRATREPFDRAVLIRMDGELYERIGAMISAVPALHSVSKSEFIRRSIRFALATVDEKTGR